MLMCGANKLVINCFMCYFYDFSYKLQDINGKNVKLDQGLGRMTRQSLFFSLLNIYPTECIIGLFHFKHLLVASSRE